MSRRHNHVRFSWVMEGQGAADFFSGGVVVGHVWPEVPGSGADVVQAVLVPESVFIVEPGPWRRVTHCSLVLFCAML